MKITTRCDTGVCIALEPHPDGGLVLTTTRGPGSTPVTADEVRAFAAAVQSGFFDELLGAEGGG
jgi:hypothetical protein